MDNPKIMQFLKEKAKVEEIYRVFNFRGHRSDKEGNLETIDIEIRDAGPNIEPQKLRYSCTAISSSGKTATGNSNDNIESVIEHMSWNNLD